MMLVRHVIRNREPYSMNASASVQDAAEFMAARNVGAVCVVDDNGKGDVRVVVPAGWSTRGFFLLAEHNNVIVRGLEPDHEDLEELFHRLIDGEMRDLT